MDQCTFIIFGASGDLAKRKLLPALYNLFVTRGLERFVVIGIAYDDLAADVIIERVREYIGIIDEESWQNFVKCFFYYKFDFNNQLAFTTLLRIIQEHEHELGHNANRLLYFACPPQFFGSITRYCGSVGLARRQTELSVDGGWHRLVYEKPFGTNRGEAHEINTIIACYFDESQIYRIDHYLAKEIVATIALTRFTNSIFEPLWNNKYIEQVQIILTETLGVGQRGAFYDSVGVVKDIVQNHGIQLMALLAMESPERLWGDDIRTAKAEVIQKIRPIDGVMGMYEGYRHELGVASDSETPTFTILSFMIDTPSFRGVPFYIKTGKCLDKKDTSLHIKFRAADCPLKRIGPCASNYLTIQVTPDPHLSLQMNIRRPGGMHDEVMPVQMTFSHEKYFGPASAQAYETLLKEVMAGQQSVSVRSDEIEYAWDVVEKIEKLALQPYQYPKGSRGPREAEEYSLRKGIEWRD